MAWNTTVLNKLEEIKALITGSGSGSTPEIDLTAVEGLLSDINAAIVALPTMTEQLRNSPADAAVAVTLADTEYSFSFPLGTKGYTLSIRGGTDEETFRVAWASGKVATPNEPYRSYAGNVEIFDNDLDLQYQTIYFACSAGSRVIQIEYWL